MILGHPVICGLKKRRLVVRKTSLRSQRLGVSKSLLTQNQRFPIVNQTLNVEVSQFVRKSLREKEYSSEVLVGSPVSNCVSSIFCLETSVRKHRQLRDEFRSAHASGYMHFPENEVPIRIGSNRCTLPPLFTFAC